MFAEGRKAGVAGSVPFRDEVLSFARGAERLCYGFGMSETVVDLQYPIGKFVRPERVTAEDRMEAMRTLAEFPELLRNAVDGLDYHQLGTAYREGGWTVRQLVHHMADSHMNAYVRVRKALTEDWPTINAYEEKGWAKLHDAEAAPVEWSLELVESLHARWVMLLQSLTEEQWARGYVHPVDKKMTVQKVTLVYAWHCRHHLAHISSLRAARGW